jgi:serine/threonine-protein kinase HipA
MVCTALVNPADDEDLAMTLNGRKKKIRKADFIAAFNSLKLEPKQQDNIFKKMSQAKNKWLDFIDESFVSEKYKQAYKSIIKERFNRIYSN